jgi:catechol 2,3-dioxygenase-like lactoylglutathione lyase family enzyme
MEVVRERDFSGEVYERILELKRPRGKLAILEAGTMRIELFEFSNPLPRSADPARQVCDHGITHFCVEVSDIKQTYERLKAAGVYFNCPPMDFSGIAKATYGRDPDGNLFELLELAQPASERTSTI